MVEIKRERIDRKLQNIFNFPMSIVHAPMGFGKTTAVERFLQGREADVAWVAMATVGGDAMALWRRLTAQFTRIGHALAGPLAKLQSPYDPLQAAKLLDLLLDFEYVRPLVIVVDDFHLAADPRPFALIRRLVEQRIDNLHIVLITRELSQVAAVGLYHKQLCFTLTEKALRFTPEETAEYFERMGCPLDEDRLQRVMAYAEGWPSLLFVYCRAMQRGVPIGRNRTVDDILEQNLLKDLSAAQWRTLLALSLLDSFTLSLASAVTAGVMPIEPLRAFLQSGTFFVQGEVGGVYQVRGVVKSYLLERALCDPDEAARVKRCAGTWYLGEKHLAAAFECLYEAGDIETILAELNKENTPDIHFTQFSQIHRIFQALSSEMCLRYPIAYLQYLRILAMSGEKDATARCAQSLDEMERFIHTSGYDERYKHFLLGELHVIRTFTVFNDLPKMIANSRQAAAYFADGCSCIVTRKKEFTFGCPELLYLYYTEPGKLGETVARFAENVDALIAPINGCGMGAGDVIRAEHALETGRFDEAEMYAYKGYYKARLANQVCVALCAKFALARRALVDGNLRECSAVMDSLRREVLAENNPVLSTAFDLCDAFINISAGRPQAVPALVAEGALEGGSFFAQARSFAILVQQRAALAAKDNILADALCEAAVQAIDTYQNQLGYLHTTINESLAKARLMGSNVALPTLRKAVQLAQRDHIVLPFAEAPGEIAALLTQLRAADGVQAAFVDETLALCRRYAARADGDARAAAVLTAREKEILCLLEQGFKHEEIGAKLYISVTTVRYHVRNCYQKLEVNNKTLALRKARQMGLIP
ncbi:MAG: LuxR C-terminal-related transcriptional regulator [Oscillospiraceae bacterium]|nr:LuxR C-terminal-related transcriptional regulator [Oscillospiraceae bacterium]